MNTQGAPPNADPDTGWDYDRTQGVAEGLRRAQARALSKADPALVAAVNNGRLNQEKLWDTNGGLDDCGHGYQFAADRVCLPSSPDQRSWKEYGLPDFRELKKTWASEAPRLLDAGSTESEAWDVLRGTLGIEVGGALIVQTPVRQILIQDRLLKHIVEKRQDARERYAGFILPTLRDPLEVWATTYPDGIRERYLKLFTGKKDLLVVVRVNLDGSVLWNVIQRDTANMNALRLGEMVWKKY